jgi:hypothetical protein
VRIIASGHLRRGVVNRETGWFCGRPLIDGVSENHQSNPRRTGGPDVEQRKCFYVRACSSAPAHVTTTDSAPAFAGARGPVFRHSAQLAPTPHENSKQILECELRYPWIAGAGDLTQSRCAHRQAGIPQVRMIREVEEFDPELQVVAFVQNERFVNSEIPIKRARPQEGPVA